MLDTIISFSIKNKFVVLLLTLVLIIWGVWSATKLQIDAVPDITNNQVQIITACPTLAGQEVERLVTSPIERGLANLPDLEELRSISRFGLSVITVVFDEDVDIYFARQLINEKLKEATRDIPPDIGTPELAPVSTGLGEVYQYIIHPAESAERKYSAMDLRVMQDWIVARQLYGTPGIAEVNSFGGLLKQYEVALDPNKLQAMQITVPEVFTALKKNNENTGGAYIDKKPNAYFIRGVGLINSFDDIKNIVVKSNPNDIPILIKDVAEVRLGSAPRYGAMTYNGEKDAVGGVIMMLKGANSADVVRRIKEKLPVIQKSLPPDVIIEPFLDRTDLVNRAISTVQRNLVEGALIVIFALVLFLGNLRAGLIVASAIPLSMLFALGMMNIFGVSANLMSLGAIDFGLIVDGAVIIVEATMHHLGLRRSTVKLTQAEMDQEVYISASKIRSSAAFGEIIILAVYIPILTLVGIEGKMFRPMAQTVSFAILGALILSLTYIPVTCALFLPKTARGNAGFSDRIMDYLSQIYLLLLEKAVRVKNYVITAAAAIFIVAAYVFFGMGGEFIPTLQEGDFAFHCILPQGTSLSQSIETSMQASRLALQFDEVKMVVGKTGSAEVPTDPMPVEATDMMIILKPQSEWESNISYDELAEKIEHKFDDIPGVFFEKNQPIQMRFNELMTGSRQDVAVKIFGENLDTLLAYAKKTADEIRKVPGTTVPMIERTEGLPQIAIRYNRSQIANYGMNIEDINHIVSAAFAGGKAGVVFENERRFDLVVRLDSAYRNDISDIGRLFLPAPDGAQIPLSQVAEISYELGPAQISREAGKRRIVIGFNTAKRDVESVVQDIQNILSRNVKLPEGYYFSYGGVFEHLQVASKRLAIAVPIALALIFVLLFFTFHSVRQAVLIYMAIPMSAIGGVFALIIRDMPFSISAGIGFIALFGVAVLNGIVLISAFNNLEKEGVADIMERMKKGAATRLRPVLMTAAVASFGFLPMAFSHSAGAEVQKPLATVVIGGLISATFLTLFVLPLLYLIFTNKKNKNNKRRKNTSYIPAALFAAIILLIGSYSAEACKISEKPVFDLERIVNAALKNNLQIQARKLSVKSSEKIKKSTFELPDTEFNLQYGQYSSINRDLGFTLSQTIPFPMYFAAKADLFDAESQEREMMLQAASSEIIMQIKTLYYDYIFLLENKKTFAGIDSAYTDFERVASLRHKTGESGFLEKNTAEVRRNMVKIQIKQIETDIETTLNSLKTLVNSSEEFDVAVPAEYKPMALPEIFDTSRIAYNPGLNVRYRRAESAERSAELERAALFPDLVIGYFNQSIIGTQNINGQEIYFDQSKRFQGVNIGLAFPLAFSGSTSRIASLDLQVQALQKEADNEKSVLRAQLQNLIKKYNLNLLQYDFYKSSAMPAAESAVSVAALSYRRGNIGYVEYLQASQNAYEIRLNYLRSIGDINRAVIQINFILGI